jgi:preprotein translocase subunit SecG
LTKITKYVASSFFVFAILLSILYVRRARSTSSELEAELGKGPVQRMAPVPVLPTNALRTTAFFGTNQSTTNAPSVPTNPPPALPK